MPQIVGLASLAVAFVVPLVTARAILGGIVSLLLKRRHRGTQPSPAPAATRTLITANSQG
jgi:hypothetical protein